jgi:subtilisin family serine protease
MCPTPIGDRNQNNPDCSKGADIVNNSWGCGGGSTFFRQYADAWLDAGIIPVFSNGNAGPVCGSAGSPSDFVDVMGIGAVDITGELASFSSRGPGAGSVLKPDFVAPGKLINSATSRIGANDREDQFAVNSGTSMAAVSGIDIYLNDYIYLYICTCIYIYITMYIYISISIHLFIYVYVTM